MHAYMYTYTYIHTFIHTQYILVPYKLLLIMGILDMGGPEKWILPFSAVEQVLKCLKDDSDEIVRHYAAKVISLHTYILYHILIYLCMYVCMYVDCRECFSAGQRRIQVAILLSGIRRPSTRLGYNFSFPIT